MLISASAAVDHGAEVRALFLLEANPLDRITWRPPRSSCSADLRSAATPAEVQAILAEVTQIRPELTGVLRLPVLRGTAPRRSRRVARSCILPSSGWGQLTLTASLPRSARAWTGNGTPREPRSLKHRPQGAIRTVPILWVPKTCVTWADPLREAGGSVRRSASVRPVLARPEVG